MNDRSTLKDRYACTVCAEGFSEVNNCPKCDEPLLDSYDRDVRALLGDLDRAAYDQRLTRLLLLFAGPGLLLGAALGVALVSADFVNGHYGRQLIFGPALGVAAVGALLARWLTRRTFVPRFCRWSDYVDPR